MKENDRRFPRQPTASVRLRHQGVIIAPDQGIFTGFQDHRVTPGAMQTTVMFITLNSKRVAFFRDPHTKPAFLEISFFIIAEHGQARLETSKRVKQPDKNSVYKPASCVMARLCSFVPEVDLLQQ